MSVDSVFVSSVMTGFEEVRQNVASALSRIGVHAVLAERHPADPQASRQAMFDEIEKADYFLLLLGERYGEPDDSGLSPTEQEFDHADSLSRPALVLVQEGTAMEPDQERFLEKVRGTWSDGVFYDQFRGKQDVGEAVLAAVNAQARQGLDNIPAATEEVARLLEAPDHNGSGIAVRVAFSPVRELTLLDALTLEDQELPARLMEEIRAVRLVSHEIGLKSQVSAAGGIEIEGTDQENWTTPQFAFLPNGTILVTCSVRSSNDTFPVIDPGLLRQRIEAAGDLATHAWNHIDSRNQVTRIATGVSIPDAQYKTFGEPAGNSVSMSSSLPTVVKAPQVPEVVSVGSIATDDHANRLVAGIRRVFLDAGAVGS